MITIRPFTADDLSAAGKITLALWGDETPQIPQEYLSVFYEYLPRYYFHAASPLNFAAVDDKNGLQGMLLAVPATLEAKHGETEAYEWLKARLSPESHSLLDTYQSYLDGNRQKESEAMQPDDAVMLLYASIQPGCGRELMRKFTEACRREKLTAMLLWTDETCDWEYYPKHGFTQIAKHKTEPPLFDLQLNTYLFRKPLKD